MKRAWLAALCGAALLAAGCSDKGKVREPAELVEIPEPAFKPDVVWRRSVGEQGGFSTNLGIALQADGVFVADQTGTVTALDPATGAVQWKTRAAGNLQAGPSLGGNAVYVGNRDGTVVALARADGTELWRSHISSEVQGAPVSNGDVVVARSVDGRTFGLSASSGVQLWVFDRSVPELVLHGMSPPLLVAGRALVGMDNGRLAAVSASDGTVLWEQTVSVPQGRTVLDRMTDIDGAMVDGGSCVFAASFGGQVACIELSSGQALWRRDVRSYDGIGIDDGKIYLSDESSVVWALDQSSGAAAWKQEDLLYRKLSAPVVYKGYVVVADAEGYLHWMDAADGHFVARSKVGTGVTAQMIASDELLYVLDTDGKLSAISIP